LKEHYQELEDMSFVSANVQTNGRGRNNRIWKSENGNLLFSLLLLNKQLIEKYKEISILTAYSITQVLKEYNINSMIKWPNDIYVNDKKICGILLEAITKEEIECLIVGIGINVNQEYFEGEYLHEPTSLKKELKKDIDLNEFKNKIYTSIENNLKQLLNNNDFYNEISKLDYLKDKEVYALINEEKKKIKVLGINKDYSLKIISDNNIQNLESGEISFHY